MASNHTDDSTEAADEESSSGPKPRIRLDRPVYTQTQFDEGYQAQKRQTKTMRERYTCLTQYTRDPGSLKFHVFN